MQGLGGLSFPKLPLTGCAGLLMPVSIPAVGARRSFRFLRSKPHLPVNVNPVSEELCYAWSFFLKP